MATKEYTLRLEEALWDFGPGVGAQRVMCFHQYVDADGVVVTPPDTGTGGAWEGSVANTPLRRKSFG